MDEQVQDNWPEAKRFSKCIEVVYRIEGDNIRFPHLEGELATHQLGLRELKCSASACLLLLRSTTLLRDFILLPVLLAHNSSGGMDDQLGRLEHVSVMFSLEVRFLVFWLHGNVQIFSPSRIDSYDGLVPMYL